MTSRTTKAVQTTAEMTRWLFKAVVNGSIEKLVVAGPLSEARKFIGDIEKVAESGGIYLERLTVQNEETGKTAIDILY
jgi:hypothetical protein